MSTHPTGSTSTTTTTITTITTKKISASLGLLDSQNAAAHDLTDQNQLQSPLVEEKDLVLSQKEQDNHPQVSLPTPVPSPSESAASDVTTAGNVKSVEVSPPSPGETPAMSPVPHTLSLYSNPTSAEYPARQLEDGQPQRDASLTDLDDKPATTSSEPEIPLAEPILDQEPTT